MSVHGEFSRALEALIDRLRGFDHSATMGWIALLEETRIGQQPDLSAAAHEAVRILGLIRNHPDAKNVSGLVDPMSRLEAHCRAVLGT